MREKFDQQIYLKELSEIDGPKDIFYYNHSEENEMNCKYFELSNQKYILLQKQYANSFQELYSVLMTRHIERNIQKVEQLFIEVFILQVL